MTQPFYQLLDVKQEMITQVYIIIFWLTSCSALLSVEFVLRTCYLRRIGNAVQALILSGGIDGRVRVRLGG